MPKKHVLEAIATLVGMTIGAGILAIPYVVARAGFLTGVLNIIIIGVAILTINLYVGEVSLRTKQEHQLTGYAKNYLGRIGKYIMVFSMIFGMYGALIAYIIKEGEFLSAILSPIFGGSSLLYSIIFFLVAGFLVYKGLETIEKSELLMVIFILLIVIFFLIASFPSIKIEHLTQFNLRNIFIPYGVVLFAFMGMAAIPEINEELRKNKKEMKKVIIVGSLISLVVYMLFAFIVVGVTGVENVTDGAIIGLGNVLGYRMLVFGIIFGVLTMATSFIAIGLALKEMYNFDFKLKEPLSSFLVCFVPLVVSMFIILIRIDNAFFKVIDVTGALSGSLMGILIVLMLWKAKKLGDRKPEYSIHENRIIGFLLILMFLAGIVYEILKIVNFLRV